MLTKCYQSAIKVLSKCYQSAINFAILLSISIKRFKSTFPTSAYIFPQVPICVTFVCDILWMLWHFMHISEWNVWHLFCTMFLWTLQTRNQSWVDCRVTSLVTSLVSPQVSHKSTVKSPQKSRQSAVTQRFEDPLVKLPKVRPLIRPLKTPYKPLIGPLISDPEIVL